MRGYGKSDPPTPPINRRDDLYQLFNHLKVDRAALLGCSMSGEIALDLALEHPEIISALILVSAVPVGFDMQGEPPPGMMEMIGAAQSGDIDRTSELQIRLWVDGMFRQPEDVDPDVRRRAAEMNRISVVNNTWAVDSSPQLNPLDPPAVERLGEVSVPVLIIDGALDHPEILRAADVMTAEIANARKVVIPDTAHVPNMEKPSVFNQAVLEFLAQPH